MKHCLGLKFIPLKRGLNVKKKKKEKKKKERKEKKSSLMQENQRVEAHYIGVSGEAIDGGEERASHGQSVTGVSTNRGFLSLSGLS
jgi:hypothetical protein